MRLSALAFSLFLSLILCQFQHASVQWSYSAQGAINGKPVFLSDKVVFSTYEGKIYAFSADRGAILWVFDASSRLPVPVVRVSPDTLAAAGESGRLSFISPAGKEIGNSSLPSAPFYLAGDAGNAYLSFRDGVRAYSSAGKLLWSYALASQAGPVSVHGPAVYFTSGGKLYSLAAKTGALNWAVAAGDSFQSAPVEEAGSVYFGATDGRLYSFNSMSGRLRWSYQTDAWVQSTPAYYDGSLFFGSNDGKFYAITDSGKLRFSFKAGEAVWTEPSVYTGSGRQMAVFGSNDGNIYGLDESDGSAVWSFSAAGRIGGISERNGVFFFGTSSGRFYSLSPSPSCSFSWPPTGTTVGDWPVEVEGTAYSDLGVQQVEVRMEGGPWLTASGTDKWRAEADFTGVPYGSSRVECRASDSSGRKATSDFSSIIIVKAQNVPLQKMSILAPSEAPSNETVKISVLDSRGADLANVGLSVAGEKKAGDSPFFVVLGKTGSVKVAAEKAGFEPASSSITGTGGSDILVPALSLLALCALAFFAYRKFIAKK